MGFWNKVKQFFGAGADEPATQGPPASAELVAEIRRAVRRRMKKQKLFTVRNVARRVFGKGKVSADNLRVTYAAIGKFADAAFLQRFGYTRSTLTVGGASSWVFHPAGRDPWDHPAFREHKPGVATKAATAATAKQPSVSKATPAADAPDPLDTSGILGLSKNELRARALKINPFNTPWIGRVDTIPPQSDERTAIIDRGLILRGLLTEKQIEEIHRVGDLWLRFHDADRLAEAEARRRAESAVQDARAEREKIKQEKKRLATERDAARAREVARRKAEDIVFLGRGVSKPLADRRSNVEKLRERNLPVLATPGDVAAALGIPIPELRWLCFHSETVTRMHYVQFTVPKRSGGERLLSSPLPKLAKAQRWVLEDILERLQPMPEAHGFVKRRSTVTNAREHRGRDVVINLDLEDFFPSVTLPRVFGMFKNLGYSPAVATIFALICTEAPRRSVVYDGKKYWVAVGERGLPQGACTSPSLSNWVTRGLDRRLAGLGRRYGLGYTRYADDLTFSGPREARSKLAVFLSQVRHIVDDEGFSLQLKKGRLQRPGGRQLVTGIVVNDAERLGLPRDELRRLRALLHNAKKTGLMAQNREKLAHFEAYLRGKIAYVHMVQPDKAARLSSALDALG
jgi:RNA-directed DNA polymerase